jgi:hypothetical protein
MPDPLDNSAPFNDKQGTRIANEPADAGAEANAPRIHPTKPEEPRRDPRDMGSEATARREPPSEPDIPRSRR